jgi:hypothetical protein
MKRTTPIDEIAILKKEHQQRIPEFPTNLHRLQPASNGIQMRKTPIQNGDLDSGIGHGRGCGCFAGRCCFVVMMMLKETAARRDGEMKRRSLHLYNLYIDVCI